MNLTGIKKNSKKLKKKLTLNVLRKGWVNITRENHLKFTQKEKEIDMVKFQMLLKKQCKCYKKKTDKAQTMTVESSKAKKTNYSPDIKKNTSRTKNGRKQFKTVVIGKI